MRASVSVGVGLSVGVGVGKSVGAGLCLTCPNRTSTIRL